MKRELTEAFEANGLAPDSKSITFDPDGRQQLFPLFDGDLSPWLPICMTVPVVDSVGRMGNVFVHLYLKFTEGKAAVCLGEPEEFTAFLESSEVSESVQEYLFLAVTDLDGKPCYAMFTDDQMRRHPQLAGDANYRQAFVDGLLSEQRRAALAGPVATTPIGC